MVAAGASRRVDRESHEESSCPVCAEIERAEQHWLDAVHAAAKLDDDLWTVYPLCPTHIGCCVDLGEPELALSVLRHAAEVQRSALGDGMQAIERDERERHIASASVFYRRQGPAYILGQQRKMATSMPHCPACERLMVAQTRAVSGLLDALGASDRAAANLPVVALCVKHFAAVYIDAPEGKPRTALVAGFSRKLRRLRQRLQRAQQAADTSQQSAAVREALETWRTAMPASSGK